MGRSVLTRREQRFIASIGTLCLIGVALWVREIVLAIPIWGWCLIATAVILMALTVWYVRRRV